MLNLLAIIVVFKQQPAATPSLQSLLAAQRALPNPSLQLGILVYDNTPGGQEPGAIPDGVTYIANPDNPGLARPYNEALRFAKDHGFEWLLTLDQDTNLPLGYLKSFVDHATELVGTPDVAAIVPQISDHGRIISPFRFVGGFLPLVLGPDSRGLAKRHTSALNSGALLRVSSLLQLNGYEARFPLHNSDTCMFQRLDEAGMRVFIARDMEVHHELAILQRQERMTVERYRMCLEDECDFWDRHMGVLGRTERIVRLAGRVGKGFLQGEDPRYRNIALKEMLRRLFTSRSSRLRATDARQFPMSPPRTSSDAL